MLSGFVINDTNGGVATLYDPIAHGHGRFSVNLSGQSDQIKPLGFEKIFEIAGEGFVFAGLFELGSQLLLVKPALTEQVIRRHGYTRHQAGGMSRGRFVANRERACRVSADRFRRFAADGSN